MKTKQLDCDCKEKDNENKRLQKELNAMTVKYVDLLGRLANASNSSGDWDYYAD